jgi:hypothetical protein
MNKKINITYRKTIDARPCSNPPSALRCMLHSLGHAPAPARHAQIQNQDLQDPQAQNCLYLPDTAGGVCTVRTNNCRGVSLCPRPTSQLPDAVLPTAAGYTRHTTPTRSSPRKLGKPMPPCQSRNPKKSQSRLDSHIWKREKGSQTRSSAFHVAMNFVLRVYW